MSIFIDKVKIKVQSGKGGDGVIAFLREKYVARGGPAGGNGGRGGSIFLLASKDVHNLSQFKYAKTIKAEGGGKGENKNRYGKDAEDIIIKVPVGTVVYETNEQENKYVVDLSLENQKYEIVKGGRGGRGNASFRSSVNRAPKIAENGVPGEEKEIILELKLLADVGIIGLPNAGKSTLLSVISNAKPEVADYAFTTITPNLGVVNLKGLEPFVIADLPGIIEGAHEGKGLGLRFLRHLERCRVLIHVIDVTNNQDAYQNYLKVNHELKLFHPSLLKRPMVIAASKIDDMVDDTNLKLLKRKIKNRKIFPISSLSEEGLFELISYCYDLLQQTPIYPIIGVEEKDEVKVYKAVEVDDYTIIKRSSNVFVIQGERVEKTYKMINLSTDEGILKLLAYLRRIKVDERLKNMNAKNGDTVILGDFEFDYYE